MSNEISTLQYEDVRKQIGHYKKMDYHPEIRPAGIVVLTEGIKDSFKEYKLQDGIDALKYSSIISDKDEDDKAFNNSSKIGITASASNPENQTGVKSCFEMNKNRTPFQWFIDEIRNTAMNSYWKKEVGKIPDQKSNLPYNVDPVLTTFGNKTKSDEPASELINPQKSVAEVIHDSCKGHSLYRKSHNDYYPSEQVNREYEEPFNAKYRYGREMKTDKSGGKVKRSMKWFDQEVSSVVSNLQADFKRDNEPRLGHTVVRSDIEPVLQGRTFGRVSTRGSYGVEECLKDSLANDDKPMQKEYLEHINSIRISLRKRSISFSDLYETFVCRDKNKKGTITMKEAYQILGTFHIHPDKKIFQTLLNALNLVKDCEVSYKDLTDLLNWKCEFPLLPKIEDIPLEHRNYCSTYKDTFCDATFRRGNHRHSAGLSTERIDLPYAVVPPGRPRCEKESLGDQTSVASILSPNIFTQNGLSHLEFFKIRKADEIRELFQDIGVNFPGDSFNVIWNEGLKKDCTGGVCVETFRSLLDRLAAASYEEIPIL